MDFIFNNISNINYAYAYDIFREVVQPIQVIVLKFEHVCESILQLLKNITKSINKI